MVHLGIDVLAAESLAHLKGARIGLIANAASVNSVLEHSVDVIQRAAGTNLVCLFGPQHGVWGDTQDNMIEWESFRDRKTGLPVYSLYGETRKPTPEMLEGLDGLVFDVQDVGTRVYTFIYTMAMAMEAAAEAGKRFIVLDRPNPLGGIKLEGNLLEDEYKSFVGMYPIPMRHGMTVGELALMFNSEFGINCDLNVVEMKGWRRHYLWEDTGLTWVMPSPNIPTAGTGAVYPGTVFLEGTNISEGRGTTRPFEILGAPYIDPHELAGELTQELLPGAVFRPLYFTPTFQKYAGQTCGGVQIHIIDRELFRPVITGVAIISCVRRLYAHAFAWRQPPYEYVSDRLPFDVISGTSRLRKQIEDNVKWRDIEDEWRQPLAAFQERRRPYLRYD
ncbi:MAG TPA: DUF1343 domain-containing protein [Blastocatellia bacterium]